MTAKRAQGITLLREHAHTLAKRGDVAQAHRDLVAACKGLLHVFRTEFDVPGMSYFETYPDDGTPGTQMALWLADLEMTGLPPAVQIVRLNRIEFLSRQGIIPGEESKAL